MNIEYIGGSDINFTGRLEQLAAKYNAEGRFPFSTTFPHPEKMFIVEFEGVGTILVDVLDDWNRAIVQLLFVNKEHRGNGHGRALVNSAAAIMASKGGLLVGAYVDIGDPQEFWIKIGYDIEATVNMSMALICASTDICFPNAKKEEITFESISEFILKRHS